MIALITLLALSFGNPNSIPTIVDEEQLEFALGKYDLVVVRFHGPQCTASILNENQFDEAAKLLQPGVLLASVDCGTSSQFCHRRAIVELPTLVAFRPSDYKEHRYPSGLERTTKNIKDWVELLLSPCVTTSQVSVWLNSTSQIDGSALAVGNIDNLSCSDSSETVLTVGHECDELGDEIAWQLAPLGVRVVASSTSSVVDVLLCRRWAPPVVLRDVTDVVVLRSWVSQSLAERHVFPLDDSSILMNNLADSHNKTAVIVFADNVEAAGWWILDSMERKKDMTMLIAERSFYGLLEDRVRSLCTEDGSLPALPSYVSSIGVVHATAPVWCRRSPGPNVRTLRRTSSLVHALSSVSDVADDDRDWLIVTCVSWCGHCEALVSVMDVVAAELQSVVVGWIDVSDTAVDVDVPDICLYKGKGGVAKMRDGPRGVEDVKLFVERNLN